MEPILVWGAGAMGGTIGASLVRSGQPVLFVDRDVDHVAAMNREGLTVEGPIESFRVRVDALRPEQLTGSHGRVLLCVKAHHTREAVAQLAPFVEEEGYVVSIQNGLNEHAIAEALGAHRTIGAFVNFGADYLAPGRIHWGGRGAVVVGELDGSSTPRLEDLHRVLQRFEPNAIATDNIFGYLWSKLAYAALLFATALTNESIADCLASTEHRPVLLELAREVCRVADGAGIILEPFDGFDPGAFSTGATPEAGARSLEDLVVFNRRSAKTHSGIWRDLAVRKRRTEVDEQLEPVVHEGKRLGIPTPLVERVVAQIHEIEAGARTQTLSNLDELRDHQDGQAIV